VFLFGEAGASFGLDSSIALAGIEKKE